MPTVRIPVSPIERVWGISWGVKFSTPSRPDLDGTVFKENTFRGGRELRAAIEARGIVVVEMPVGVRAAGWFRDFGTQQANGFRWLRQTIRWPSRGAIVACASVRQ